METVRPMEDAHTGWLDLPEGASVLRLRAGEALPEERRGFDTIVCIGCLEEEERPAEYLSRLSRALAPDGRLLLYCDNRLGLRYFSGEPDPYTHRFGDGLVNYIHASEKQRCYTLQELKAFLAGAGYPHLRVYSVLPGIEDPRLILAEDYRPAELLSIRYRPEYRAPENVFLEEEYVIDALLENGLLPGMADGLLLEASRAPLAGGVLEAVLSSDRRPECAMLTRILRNGSVEKRPLRPEGGDRPLTLAANEERLRARGIRTVGGRAEKRGAGWVYVSDYRDAPLANAWLKELFFSDREAFIRAMDRFREQILAASELLPGEGHLQRCAFPDMVPLNCFVEDGDYVFFDQEFTREAYPADAIVARTILIVYEEDIRMELALPRAFFFERYGLMPELGRWLALAREFTDDFALTPPQGGQAHFRDYDTVLRNRHRLNYPEALYEKLMYNPVAGLEEKELYLYGTGETTAKFIEMYQRDFPIRAVLLPVSEIREERFAAYPVLPADLLRSLDPGGYRVVICTPEIDRDFRYMQSLGAADIVAYQPEKVYPGRQASMLHLPEAAEKKPYHIGYIAGVFDLYHLGHLNMFKRAKALCDYLIVGVVTDAGVRDFKKTEPFIPFEERIEMVRSCRYVNEAVEIPYYYRGTIEAFEKYHFDVQFSGSDYEHNPLWLYHKSWLEERGSAMVFFPYTEGTSSSKIKDLIDKQLI